MRTTCAIHAPYGCRTTPFIDEGASQCGFCLSGVILTAKAVLDAKPDASDVEIRAALGGVLCRCFTHTRMLRAMPVDDAGMTAGGTSCVAGAPRSTLRAVERSRLSPFGLVLLALVTVAWGLSWPAIKLVLTEVPPLTFRAICLVVGGAGVLALARLAGQSLHVPARAWGRLLVIAACNIVGWNTFKIYGIAHLPSGRAALIGYTMPMWSTLFSVWLLGERLTVRRGASLVLGMAGVVVLLAAEAAGMASATTGVVLMLASAMSWGLSVVLLKRFALPAPTACLTGWMMLAGSVPFVAGAVVLEHDRWRPVTATVGLGLTYSVVIAFMFGYWAWNRVVLMVPVAVSSVSILAVPVISLLSGAWLLHEPLTWRELVAGACILGAITLVLGSPAARRADR